MKRSPSRHAFTLIEMITVITIIAILTGLVLSIAGLVQNKGTRSKAQAEINALSAACEAYKADLGSYPQETATDSLDARSATAPSSYQAASLALYKALSGDTDLDGKPNSNVNETGKVYATDFFKPARFNSSFKANGKVAFITDPFGNSYGYSTAGLKAEQDFRTQLATDDQATRAAASKGYNSTFDLWSTGGATGSSDNDKGKWLKNW